MKDLNSFIWLMRIFNQMIHITHTFPFELTLSFYSSIFLLLLRLNFLEWFYIHHKVNGKTQKLTVYTWRLHMHNLLSNQHSPLEGYICYNWWIYIKISLSCKVHVYIRVLSWCNTVYGFWQMYNDMYLPLWYHPE